MRMAYVRVALSRRGVFRLMFGPEMAKRASFPELKSAADQAFQWLKGGVQARGRAAQDSHLAAIAPWALVHGLAQLFLDGVLPETGLKPSPRRSRRHGAQRPAIPSQVRAARRNDRFAGSLPNDAVAMVIS